MSKFAIFADSIGKRYMLGQRRDRTDLRETVTEAIRAPFSALASAWNHKPAIAGDRVSERCMWALRDVSFEVQFGELIGIMGDNGSGKTTLLKILSGITKPTVGYGEIRGRVGTLLDLGAGVHGELTGRENVYLNGAVKGMTRLEVKHKFDEIVAFAELEGFIDTPLKYYSCGMCVRLAFAVAVHLESEILLVDEVLAHADSTFQKKCLERIASAGKEGRTVLMVSHDIDSIRRICSRGLVFVRGRIVCNESASEAVEYYRAMSGGQFEPLEVARTAIES